MAPREHGKPSTASPRQSATASRPRTTSTRASTPFTPPTTPTPGPPEPTPSESVPRPAATTASSPWRSRESRLSRPRSKGGRRGAPRHGRHQVCTSRSAPRPGGRPRPPRVTPTSSGPRRADASTRPSSAVPERSHWSQSRSWSHRCCRSRPSGHGANQHRGSNVDAGVWRHPTRRAHSPPGPPAGSCYRGCHGRAVADSSRSRRFRRRRYRSWPGGHRYVQCGHVTPGLL